MVFPPKTSCKLGTDEKRGEQVGFSVVYSKFGPADPYRVKKILDSNPSPAAGAFGNRSNLFTYLFTDFATFVHFCIVCACFLCRKPNGCDLYFVAKMLSFLYHEGNHSLRRCELL